MIWLLSVAACLVTGLAGLFCGFLTSFPAGWICGRTHTHVPEWLPARVKALAHMHEQEGAQR